MSRADGLKGGTYSVIRPGYGAVVSMLDTQQEAIEHATALNAEKSGHYVARISGETAVCVWPPSKKVAHDRARKAGAPGY